MSVAFDGNWIDVGSIAGGAIYALFKWGSLIVKGRPWNAMKIALYGINGLALFPVLILMLGVFYSGLLTELLQASRVTLFIAGLVAFISLLSAE